MSLRDRRAVRFAPAPGAATAGADPPRVVVVGGGIAGLSAASALARRGVRVVVLERAESLGGRLRGWHTTLRDGSDATMTRGFHAFFRQYYNLRALLRRADPALAALTPLPDYPLVHRDGRRDSFAGLPTAPPWNAAAFVATSPSFGWRELSRVNIVAAMELLDVDVPGVYERLDRMDALTFLRRVRFPEAARHLAFEVFSRSFFAHPGRLSAAELATMFHIYFLGSSEGLLFDVPAEPFPRALWNPLAERLRADGVRLRTGARAGAVLPGSRRRFAVPVRGGLEGPDVEDADAVVLATDVAGLRELVAASPELGDPGWRRRVAGLRTAPPFLVSRLWLDRPVHADRPAFLGTSGFPTLDNVTVLDRYEGEARRWARGCGGSVVELHGYALREGADPAAEHRRLVGQLHEVYPETAGARIVDQRYELAADCPLFAPGGHAERPTVSTPDPHVTLAGDLVRVDLPVALMERAATTGLLAANSLLSRWRLAGHPVWSVPVRGRFTAARALARALRAPRPR